MKTCQACAAENPARARFCLECGSGLDRADPARKESRRTVTVLFADVTGSTAIGERLDPEAVRALMTRYFAAVKAVIERHGGTVEKFIGDAVMAVFGVPVIHEDDALRAVRAAAGMREALTLLNQELEAERGVSIAVRTGIMTGEVVAGDPTVGQTLVTGDTVNTAARLEQAAAPGEILIGEPTYRLVRDAVDVEAVEPLVLKGKEHVVAAYRLRALIAGAEAHMRRMDVPLIGRERELDRLVQSYAAAVTARRCELFTLLGPAGVGKSRLVREFLLGVESDATILRGRCLPYGEGITYWPLAEAVRSAAGIEETDAADAALSKLLALLDGERDAELIAGKLAEIAGLSEATAAQHELFWAVRRTFEHLARTRPLVVVWEDIHWAERAFLDLIDHLAEWSRDAPILLLCPARPELLDDRADWGGGKLNATTILLEALPPAATDRLLDALPGGGALPAVLRERIASAAEGNPLFVEEMVAMLVDDGRLAYRDGRWTVAADIERLAIPPTISALIAARLDRLEPNERAVAERASVVGRIFEPEAVGVLAPSEVRPHVMDSLMGLVRKELVRPDRSDVTGGDAFRFRHILIRDAAYDALPKDERADLHERFANWLDGVAGDRRGELAEIIAHHLERAAAFRTELGPMSDHTRALRSRAADLLVASGRQALIRLDGHAAESLFGRALPLLDEGTAAAREARYLHARALRIQGHYGRAAEAFGALLEVSRAAGDEVMVHRARVGHLDAAAFIEPAKAVELERAAVAAIERLTALRDAAGLALAYRALGACHGQWLRWGAAAEAAQRALEVSRTINEPSTMLIGDLALALVFGPAPLDDAIRILERRSAEDRMQFDTTAAQACLHLLRGDADAAALLAQASAIADDLGESEAFGMWHVVYAQLDLYLGHSSHVAEVVAPIVDVTRRNDNELVLRTVLSVMAEAHVQEGRLDEARRHVDEAALADESDPLTHVSVNRTRARLAMADGDLDTAAAYVDAAVALLAGSDDTFELAEALIVRAEIAWRRRDVPAMEEALSRASTLAARKGATAYIARIEALAERLAAQPRIRANSRRSAYDADHHASRRGGLR